MAPRLPSRCWAHLSRRTTPSLVDVQLQQPPRIAWAAVRLLSRTSRRPVKYGWSTLPRRVARPEPHNLKTPGLPPPTTGHAAAAARRARATPLRTGVLATKKGMTAFYSKRGTRIPCTVLQMENVQVVAAKTAGRDGYWAVQVGCGDKRAATAPAPLLGFYEAKGVAPKEHLVEFRVRDASGLLPVGARLMPDWLHLGQWVDVRSTSRGMGFAGGMKRHGFKGQEASHGNSLNHRTIGSTGPSQGSGSRVMPGKKMPGRMGGQRVTVQNLSVLHFDNELGIVVVKGAVGGPKGALVQIQDAVKKPPPEKEWIAKTNDTLLARTPDAADQLREARRRHLELKTMRREGRISELLESGVSVLGMGSADAATTAVADV